MGIETAILVASAITAATTVYSTEENKKVASEQRDEQRKMQKKQEDKLEFEKATGKMMSEKKKARADAVAEQRADVSSGREGTLLGMSGLSAPGAQPLKTLLGE